MNSDFTSLRQRELHQNAELAWQCLREFCQAGVKEVLVCAGARNAPLVLALEAFCRASTDSFQVHSFYNESASAFFALGRIRAKNQPVAVITTSGTAVAQCLPACVEAFYSCLPLLIVSADRPRSYRLSGAPQSIEQVGIFSVYTGATMDAESGPEMQDKLQHEFWDRRGPRHWNLCFAEPEAKLTSEIPVDLRESGGGRFFQERGGSTPSHPQAEELVRISEQVMGLVSPIVIVSHLVAEQGRKLLPLLLRWRRPVLLEATASLDKSALRKAGLLLEGGERSALAGLQQGWIGGVLRIGGVPTTRLWRDLEGRPDLNVLHFSDSGFSGLGRNSQEVWPLSFLFSIGENWSDWEPANGTSPDALKKLQEVDGRISQSLSSALREYPRAELAWTQQVYHRASDNDLYVGNSLPIREIDTVANLVDRQPRRFGSQRGANGIDGQISSFLGWALPEREAWCLVGDLTALYDLSSPWAIASAVEKTQKLRIVVLNNGGGRIFAPMFSSPLFINAHSLGFAGWAQMWGLGYRLCEAPEDFSSALPDRVVIEVRPDSSQSEALQNRLRSFRV